MTEPSKAVFLSYASQDAEAARRIADALRAAGIEVWFDESELRGGDTWDRQIRRQIHECALFVAVISAHTDARPEGYFRREWRFAVDRTLDMADDQAFLLPVVIDGMPDATARVPDGFRAVQWSRLPAGEAPPAFIERVSRLLSPDAHAVSASARRPADASPATGAVHTEAANPSGRTSAPTVQSDSPALSTIPEKSIAVLAFANLSGVAPFPSQFSAGKTRLRARRFLTS